jgi:hypothetical protein
MGHELGWATWGRVGGPHAPSGPWGGGGRGRPSGLGPREGRGLKLPLLFISYFFCYRVFRFWFLNFEIQMSFENLE